MRFARAFAPLLVSCAIACDALIDFDALERGAPPVVSKDAGTSRLDMQLVEFDRKPNVTFRAVWVERPDSVTIVGEDGALIHFDGENWVSHPNGAGIDLNGVWTSESDGFVVGETRDTHRGIILRRSAGDGWDQLATVDHGLHAVWGTRGRVFAGGNDGALYEGPLNAPFTEAAKFLPIPGAPLTPFAPIVWSIGGLSAANVLVAGDVDAYFHFDGKAWATGSDKVDPTRAYRAVWGDATSQSLLLGANYYGLWQRDPIDGGDISRLSLLNEDRSDPENRNRYLWGVWSAGDQVVAVGTGGRIVTWDPEHSARVIESPAGTKTLYAISASSRDDVWIVGEAGTILHGRVTF